PTTIYTLSLHDALPILRDPIVQWIEYQIPVLTIWVRIPMGSQKTQFEKRVFLYRFFLYEKKIFICFFYFRYQLPEIQTLLFSVEDRKSTRLNSSHVKIS